MRLVLLLAFLASSCSTTIGESKKGTSDAQQIQLKEPPNPKEGTQTSPGCDGVQARGHCDGDKSTRCDLQHGKLRVTDCAAKGERCVEDPSQGVKCDPLPQDPCTAETEKFCKDGMAYFCDLTNEAAGQPVIWNCAAGGFVCAEGACVTEDGEEPDTDCGTLDYYGDCEGETAVWCDAFWGPVERDCAALGQRCEKDKCAEGAYCCGEVTGESEEASCAAVAASCGICSPEGNLITCDTSNPAATPQATTCPAGQVCEYDSCLANAAGCCEENPVVPVNECTELGNIGECAADGQVRFCNGTDVANITTYACTGGKVCVEPGAAGSCGSVARCCDVEDPCEGLGPIGVCQGNTLRYCTFGELTERDCDDTGKICLDSTSSCEPGFAQCCP